jgi:hypothetical protein
MPFIFIGLGAVLVLVGLNGDPGQLYTLVSEDFTGKNNYVYWMVAILVLGSTGYIKGLEGLSKLFMFLVLVGLLVEPNPNTGTAAGVTFAQTFQGFLNSLQGTSTGQTGQTSTPGQSSSSTTQPGSSMLQQALNP